MKNTIIINSQVFFSTAFNEGRKSFSYYSYSYEKDDLFSILV